MMKNNISVLVSGAGVAGLSVAYWLARHGFKVTVVERAPRLRPGGQAVDVRGPSLEVAERMGILADIRKRSTRLAGMSIVDATGREIFRSTEQSFTGGRLDSPDVEILRDDLCRVLYQTVGNGADYLFGDFIVSLHQDDAGVDVTFASGAPRRFDLVIGADGLRSGVRRLAFGPDQQFIRYLGFYIAVFAVPNFLGLEHWEIFLQQDGTLMGGVLALEKNREMRTYTGFASPEPLDYDHRDIAAQKRLVADRAAGAGWVFPQLLAYMQDAPDFYFDSMNQIRMERWSSGRIVLLGDAGYSVSPATGQGTTVAMVAAYILAGELAAHGEDLPAGLDSYERTLRDYVTSNQEAALGSDAAPQTSFGEPTEGDPIADPDGIPDFGQMVQPIALKNY